MIKPIHLIATVGMLFSSLTAIASDPINYDTSKWTIHQSFDNKPRKIIDTPDVVYFFVHSRLYTPTNNGFTTAGYSGYYNTYGGSIFFFDKKNPTAGIQSLTDFVNLSGFDMRAVNYNPVKNQLVVAYSDGGLDIVDGKHSSATYIQDIKKRLKSGATTINNINFDINNGDIWIATGAGFVQIDGTTLKVLRAPEWDKSLVDIVPVGDNVMAVEETTVISAPLSSNVSLRSSYVKQTFSSGTITHLMPLSDTQLATLNTAGQIRLANPNGTNKWKLTLINQTTPGNAVATNTLDRGNYVINKLDHTVVPTSDGFYVSASDVGYFIHRKGDDGQPYANYTTLPEGEHGVYSASYDGTDFWFYNGPNKFLTKTFNGSSWSEGQEYVTNGPQTAYDNYFDYSPSHGLVMVNRHPTVMTEQFGNYLSPLVSTYRDGKWRDVSPIHHMPAMATPGSAAESVILTMMSDQKSSGGSVAKNRYPVSLPMGATVDPNNPNVLFISSPNDPGFAAIYLDDPTKLPLIHTKDNETAYDPLFAVKDFDNQVNYSTFGPTKLLGADADGVIWFYYNTNFTADNPTDLVFYAITPENREEALLLADPSVKKMKTIKIVAPCSMSYGARWIHGTALRHPSNKNKIATGSKNGDAGGLAIRILDHKGTLEDTSDDELLYIRQFRLPTGELAVPTNVRELVENPITGDIIAPGFYNTFVFNLKDPVIDGIIDARTLDFTSENGQSISFRAAVRGAGACVDEFGRYWVATHDNGVIGISADGKSVVAHYTSANSPIGENNVHSVGWNPDTKSLFISARDVVAEVRVDAPDTPASASSTSADQGIMVYPKTVTPEFGGNVAIYYVPAGITLRIRNSKGMTVRELNAVDGITHWDLMDAEGNRVPADRYTIMDSSGTESFSPLSITVTK